MAFKVRTKVEGVTDLLAGLALLKRNARNSVVRPAVAAAARVVVKAARANVKTRVRQRTGLLARSIASVVRTGRRQGSVYSVIGPRKGLKTVHPEHGTVDPVNYAHLVELGTAAHQIPITQGPFAGRTIQHPGSAPRPFLRPAIEGNRVQIGVVLRAKLRVNLEKLARRSLKRGRVAQGGLAAGLAVQAALGEE